MSEAVTNNIGDGEVDTYAVPMFKTKRWAGVKEFVVPRDAYLKMRPGRSAGDRWTRFIDDDILRNQVKDAWHKEGGVIVACDQTGAAVMLKKKKRIRATVDDDGMGSGPGD